MAILCVAREGRWKGRTWAVEIERTGGWVGSDVCDGRTTVDDMDGTRLNSVAHNMV